MTGSVVHKKSLLQGLEFFLYVSGNYIAKRDLLFITKISWRQKQQVHGKSWRKI